MSKEKHHNHDCHDHHLKLDFFGPNTELIFAILSGVFWFCGFILSFIAPDTSNLLFIIYGLSIFFGGFFTSIEAISATIKGKFEIDFLMLIAATGAIILGKWGEASLLLFLFSLGHALEHYAMKRARKSITDLVDLTPQTALLKKDGSHIEVDIESLNIGDTIIVKPNTKIAADGLVVNGTSAVNQASITGESLPVEKQALLAPTELAAFDTYDEGNTVFAGTLNGNGNLEVLVLRKTTDSTLSKLIRLVKDAEKQKSPTQLLTDKFEKYYVPGVLITVTLLMFAFLILDEGFKDSFYRAMAVLIAASPCALAISTPSAVLAAIAVAARNGVLIKGGGPLEKLADIRAVAFDKTGTITEGQPKLTHYRAFGDFTDQELLAVVVAVESLSNHPLAKAIAHDGSKLISSKNIPEAANIESIIGRGIKAHYEDQDVYIGNRKLMQEISGITIPEYIEDEMTKLERVGNTTMIVRKGQTYMGIIAVMDVARNEAKSSLARLKNIGIGKLKMLTGDNQRVADAVASSVGIADPIGNLLPEDKVNEIKKLKHEVGPVAMIGDGVNDAPAMVNSSVSIAMGAAGSDVALEAADIALMSDDLAKLPFAFGLGRKAKRIIKQNLWMSLGMVAILIPLTLTGVAEIGPAVIAHEGSTLVVVLNALRLLNFK